MRLGELSEFTKTSKEKRTLGRSLLNVAKGGLSEAAWLAAAGTVLGAKAGIVGKHFGKSIRSYSKLMPRSPAKAYIRGVSRMSGMSTGKAMKEGVKMTVRPFKRMSGGEKATVLGLSTIPGMAYSGTKEVMGG